MGPMSLKSIRMESIKSIFRAVAAADQISRAQIAAQTGLSLVTVGKVADTLLSMDVFLQEKQVKNTAGRRAGLLRLHPDKYALILDLSCRPFRYSILDLRLGLLAKVLVPSTDDNASLADDIHTLLDTALSHLITDHELSDCFGIGVSLPGAYDRTTDRILSSRLSGMESIAVRALVEEVFTGFPIYLEASENAAALSHIVSIEQAEEKNVLYWFLGEELTTGAFLASGQFLHGRTPPCQFGKLLLPDGRRMGEALRQVHTTTELVELIAMPLCDLCHLMAPDTIILDCERLRDDPDARETMLPLLQAHIASYMEPDDLPDIRITCAKFRHAHRGLAMHLREMWLYGALEE